MAEHQQIPADTSNLPKNGHPKVSVLSSNATLFWRVFVPVTGTVFCTCLVLAFWLIDEDDLNLTTSVWVPRTVVVLVLAGWILLVRRTIWRLKRVDVDDTHLYVTNYWTTVRYPWQDVERMEEKKRLGRRIVHFWLKASGRFGQVVSFLPGSNFDEWNKERKQG